MLPPDLRPRTPPRPPSPTATPAPAAPQAAPAPTAPANPTQADAFVGDSCPVPPAPRVSPQEAADNVEEARNHLDEAGEAAREKEEELQTLMARVGAGLYPEQIQDLQASFRAENAEVYEAEEAAAADLARALEEPSLSEEALIEGYEELARSPSHAQEALQWAGAYAEAHPEVAESEQFQDLTATALETALPTILANSPDAETALADLETYLGPVVRAGGGAKGVRDAFEALQASANGDYSKLGALADQWDNKLSRAIGIAAVGLGAASAVGAVREGEYLRALESLGTAGSRGLELLVGFTQSANRAATGATSSAGVLGAAALRFAGGLAALGSAAGFAQDLQAFLQGKGEGYAVAAAGDLIAFAGGVALASGVGAPVGALLIAVGTVVSAIGRIWGAESEREKIEDDLRGALERAGIPGDLADTYAEDFEEVVALGQAGFSPEEIQDLVRSDDYDKYKDNVDQLILLAESGMSREDIETFVNENSDAFSEKRNVEAFLATARAAGLQPGEYADFAEQLRESEEDWGYALANIHDQQVGRGVGGQVAPPGTRDAVLRSFLEGSFPEAFEFAQTRAPEVFGEEGQQVQEAQTDVDQIFQYGGLSQDIQFAQLVEEHQDDPAYLDAMVEYVRERGGGDDGFLDVIRQGVEIYEEDALEAFDAAVERTA